MEGGEPWLVDTWAKCCSSTSPREGCGRRLRKAVGGGSGRKDVSGFLGGVWHWSQGDLRPTEDQDRPPGPRCPSGICCWPAHRHPRPLRLPLHRGGQIAAYRHLGGCQLWGRFRSLPKVQRLLKFPHLCSFALLFGLNLLKGRHVQKQQNSGLLLLPFPSTASVKCRNCMHEALTTLLPRAKIIPRIET